MSIETRVPIEPSLVDLLAMGNSGRPHGRLRPMVLIVDDEPINIQVLGGGLGGYELIFATNGVQALEQAAAERPDLILLDVMMPDLDGFEVCRRLKADRQLAKIPVIFVTAMGQTVDEVRGLELGAVDYITKPVLLPVMRARVRTHLELKLARDLLESRALVDGLTGLANRKRLDEYLDSEWRRAQRSQQPMALVMLDIDYFKRYNDHYGHLAGDTCLRAVAGALLGALQRPADMAARYGGEEFACVLPETNEGGAAEVARRIRSGIAALALPHAASPVAPIITVSQGVTIGTPADPQTVTSILAAADQLLYAAKANGRDRIMLKDDESHSRRPYAPDINH